MLYCRRCQKLYDGPACPICGSVRRSFTPRPGDPVRLVTLPRLEAAMVSPILEEAGIPHYIAGGEAAGLNSRSFMRDVVVPFGPHQQAIERILQVFGVDSEIGRSLLRGDSTGGENEC